MYEPLEITAPTWSDDAELFAGIINKGIDARLEAFVDSTFDIQDARLIVNFHPDEVQILLRRLCEIYDRDPDNEHVGLWIDDIAEAQFGYEIY